MTGEDRWIVVPNWATFQHYGDREPVWIKVYTELNSRDDFLKLTRAGRGLLTTVWLEYARSRGELRASTVLALCDPGARYEHLKALSDAGFIELSASRPPKFPRASALAQKKRKKEEEEDPISLASEGLETETINCKNCGEPMQPRQPCPSCGVNPRAAGSNPRATAKNDREQVHQQLLEHARQVADGWDDSGGSDVFDERLDQLEMEHHDRLRALERDDLWQKAFHQ